MKQLPNVLLPGLNKHQPALQALSSRKVFERSAYD